MKNDLDAVIDFIIKQEVKPGEEHTGSYHCAEGDSGGCTKFGIAQASHPNLDIASLTRKDAELIYYNEYWMKMNADNLPPGLDLIAVDFAVNAGVSRARTLLGRIGNGTLAMVAIKLFAGFRRDYYNHLAAVNPKQQRFLKDWLTRTDRAENAAVEMALEEGESTE